MEFRKYALSLATVFAIAFTGMTEAYAETASGATAGAGIVTLSGSSSSSGAVRKRSNVRTVRTIVSTGSTASGASAAPSTSDPTYVEKNPTGIVTASPSGAAPSTVRRSARGTGSGGVSFGRSLTSGQKVEPREPDAKMVAALMGGFAIIQSVMMVFMLFITVFYGFCLYKIATKLGEPHAWLGFIPYLQAYTFVKCGGKSGWWVLWITIGFFVFMIPGLILIAIVMHGISKRYGRGFGHTVLLFFFPFIMLPVLAFSEPSANQGNSGATGYAPAYAPNVQAAPVQYPAPAANPDVDSIFAPETPVSAPVVPALETAASPATEETLVRASEPAATAVVQTESAPAIEPAAPANADANPIAKEAEAIVDNGPGFKLPGA